MSEVVSEPDEREVHVVDAPLVSPAPPRGLREVFRRRYLLRLLVRREVSARYQGSFLGLVWSYINPLTQFLTFYLIMGKLVGLGDRTENFAIHVFCGLVVVSFFTESFGAGTRSIVRNKALVKKMAMPREMFPVATMLVSLYHMGPQLVILCIASLIAGWTPDPVGIACFLLAVLLIMTLGTGLALLFAAANVFFRDFGSFVGILTNFVRFSVPMIYPYASVQERFHGHEHIFLANPIADAVLLVQRAFWVGTTSRPEETARTQLPSHLLERGLVAWVGACVVLVVGQWVFARFENKIPERLA